MTLELGPCARFAIYHLMNIEVGEERLRSDAHANGLFSQVIKSIGKGEKDLTSENDTMLQPKVNGLDHDQTNGTKREPTTSKDNTIISQSAVPKTLGELASVLRSKNSGPFELTFDVMFDTQSTYQLVKNSTILDRTTVAQILRIKEEDIIWIGFFDQALAFKVTIPRIRNGKVEPNGGFMENDVHGSQKYLDLFYMRLPESFVQGLEENQRT